MNTALNISNKVSIRLQEFK